MEIKELVEEYLIDCQIRNLSISTTKKYLFIPISTII